MSHLRFILLLLLSQGVSAVEALTNPASDSVEPINQYSAALPTVPLGANNALFVLLSALVALLAALSFSQRFSKEGKPMHGGRKKKLLQKNLQHVWNVKETDSEKLFFEGRFGSDERMLLYLDTGAKTSCMAPKLYHKLKEKGLIKHQRKSYDRLIKDASNNPMTQHAPPITVDLHLDKYVFETEFLVLEELTATLLGYNFIRKHGISIMNDGKNDPFLQVGIPEKGRIQCYSNQQKMLGKPCHDKLMQITKGFQDQIFRINAPNDSFVLAELPEHYAPLQSPTTLLKVEKGKVSLPIYNPSRNKVPISLKNAAVEFTVLKNVELFFKDEQISIDENGISTVLTKKEIHERKQEKVFMSEKDYLNMTSETKSKTQEKSPFKKKEEDEKSQFKKEKDEKSPFKKEKDESTVKKKINEKKSAKKEEAVSSAEPKSKKSKEKKSIEIPSAIPEPEVESSNDHKIDEEEAEPAGIDIDLGEFIDENKWKQELAGCNFPKDLLERFIQELEKRAPQVFATHALDCGTLDKSIMVINDLQLKEGAIVRCKPFKNDFVRREQIEMILEKMEKFGLVKKGSSEYFSPVFVVSKANNTLRLVTSYCQLNKNLKPAFYSIPDTKLVLREIAEANNGKIELFSQLDLSNAYSSILVEGKAQEQMALVTQNNTYLVQRLLFGTSVAPAYFNEAVKKVVSKINPKGKKSIFTFFDDITVVTGPDREEHMEQVLIAIQALGKAGFKLRADKCSFFTTSVAVLGCQVNKFGVMPLKKHVDAVLRLEEPTSVKEAQRIQGLLVWHSHLLPMFSERIKPISKLMQKDAIFVWGEEQKNCIKWFKETITARLMTYFPSYNLPVYVCTDASDNAVGGVAYQVRSFKKSFTLLKKELLVDKGEDVSNDLPMLPKSGKNCPRFFDLQGRDQEEIKKKFESLEIELEEHKAKNISVCCPIAYFSRSMTTCQKNYGTLEKEALAAVLTLSNFKPLLLGFRTRYFVSDSQPLLFLIRKCQDGTSKFERWLLKIREVPMEFTVIHSKGSLNVIADLLSRSYFVKIELENPNKLDKKKPVIVRSPFKIGQLITLDDIYKVMKEDPGIVFNMVPKDGTPEVKSIMEESNFFLGDVLYKKLKNEMALEKILKEQKKDEFCIKIREKLKSRKFFFTKGNILFKAEVDVNDESFDGKGRLVLPKNSVILFVAHAHLQNHVGSKCLTDLLNEEYFCPKMREQVQDFTSSCYLCMIYKSHKMKKEIPKQPYFPAKKGAVWSLDIFSNLPVVKKHKAVLTIVERYSQYVILRALKDQTAKEVRDILEKDIFAIFPMPSILMSDGASNLLNSTEIRRLAAYYDVGLHIVSPYHSPTNGFAEVMNRKASDLLRILHEQYQGKIKKSWVELIPVVMISLNCKPLSALGNFSPYEIMFGEKGKIDFKFSYEEKQIIGYPDLIREWTTERKEIGRVVKEYFIQRDKANAKKVATPMVKYQKGEWVFVKDLLLNKDTLTKLRPRVYRVPMMMMADYTGAVLVKDPLGRVRQYHKNHVMRCKTADVEKWETLPYLVRSQIGLCYTYAELEELFFDKSQIPDVFSPGNYRAIPGKATKKGPLVKEPEPEVEDGIIRPQETDVIELRRDPERAVQLRTQEKMPDGRPLNDIIKKKDIKKNKDEQEEDSEEEEEDESIKTRSKTLGARTEQEKRALFEVDDNADDSDEDGSGANLLAGPAGNTRHRVRLYGYANPVYDPS